MGISRNGQTLMHAPFAMVCTNAAQTMHPLFSALNSHRNQNVSFYDNVKRHVLFTIA